MVDAFRRSWIAEVLKAQPLIAPARQYVWPMRIAGEEDALARGALLLTVRPRDGGIYLVTCALGFSDPSVPTGVWSCPDEEEICAVAGGYAYIARASTPETCSVIALKPVVEVITAVPAELLLFVGFHRILAWGRGGVAWETERLSWEGVRVVAVEDEKIIGFGWNLVSDREVEFQIDLHTGKHAGGGWG